MKFYLGTHHPHWLWRTDVPLFISHRSLSLRAHANLAPALGRWALDSGGFTELTKYGHWDTTPGEYVHNTSVFAERISGLDFAAPQDWMCETHMLERTGLTVAEHQHRTVESVLELRRQAPTLPFIPVLQGSTVDEYLTCIDLYRQAGIDLAAEPTVGVGSVCRRENTDEILAVMAAITDAVPGIALHGFGVKSGGLRRYGDLVASADSLAWSYRARRSAPLPGHDVKHKNCANCMTFALQWRTRLLDGLTPPPVEVAA